MNGLALHTGVSVVSVPFNCPRDNHYMPLHDIVDGLASSRGRKLTAADGWHTGCANTTNSLLDCVIAGCPLTSVVETLRGLAQYNLPNVIRPEVVFEALHHLHA